MPKQTLWRRYAPHLVAAVMMTAPHAVAAEASMDDHFAAQVRAGERAGYVLFVARHGRVVHSSAIGFADLETRMPMGLQTRFRLASLTKPIVSVAAMKLVEEGRLQLSDPVSRYLPEYADVRVAIGGRGLDGRPLTEPPKRPISVLDLMTHTSGLGGPAGSNPTAEEGYGAILEAYYTRGGTAEKAALLAATPLWFQPGARFGYGIYSTDVLGRVVEVASGRPLDGYLQEEIFRPLGMRDTGFLGKGREVPGLASMYRKQEGRLRKVEQHGLDQLTAPHGGGGLYASAPDYLRFLTMVANGGELDGVRILAPSTIAMMTRNVLPRSMLPIGQHVTTMAGGFGLGFGIGVEDAPVGNSPLQPGDLFWGGSSDTFFFVSPSRGLIGIMLTQLDGSDYRGWRDFATMALAAYGQEPVEAGRTQSRPASKR